jgi:FKBP-type peptidyl-prolyl cis-trans isomerase
MILKLALATCALGVTSALTAEAPSRRAFLTRAVATATAAAVPFIAGPNSALAAPQIFTTPGGIKYAVTKESSSKVVPQDKDIVAIEYTGYLTDGSIFDATHAQGKKNALMFEVGGNAVIPGLNEMVKTMSVGQKVQAIVPPELAFGDKGICLENGECLVKPKSTLVYDIYLKTSAIPPP